MFFSIICLYISCLAFRKIKRSNNHMKVEKYQIAMLLDTQARYFVGGTSNHTPFFSGIE